MTNQQKETVQDTLKQMGKPINSEDLVASEQSGLAIDSDTNLDSFLEFISTETQKFKNVAARGSSYVSIVKSENGTRLTISKFVNEKLGYPTELYIGYKDKHLMIFNAKGLQVDKCEVKKSSSKITLYNTNLVDEIINHFSIDFTGITSKSYSDGYFENKGREVLYVKLG